jgi:hypothetical protein
MSALTSEQASGLTSLQAWPAPLPSCACTPAARQATDIACMHAELQTGRYIIHEGGTRHAYCLMYYLLQDGTMHCWQRENKATASQQASKEDAAQHLKQQC